MSSRHGTGDEAGLNTAQARRTAWVGGTMLALILLAILGTTAVGAFQQLRMDKRLLRRAEEQLMEFSEEHRRAQSLPETSQAINKLVDAAFDPAYAGIPKFLDWHYSFIGQYRQLVLWVSGRLEEETELRLLGQLEERIGVAQDSIDRVMEEEMLTELQNWFDRDLASLRPGLRLRYARVLEPILKDAKRRIALSVGVKAVRFAMADVGTSVGAKGLSSRVARRLSSGAAFRTAGRILRLGTGPVAFGVIDSLLRKLDERLNREKFEHDLTEFLDAERENVKSEITRAVDDIKLKALDEVAAM